MSDTGLRGAEGSRKRWLPQHSAQSPGEKCKDRGTRDKFRPVNVSGESETGSQARGEGGTRGRNAIERRLSMAVATSGPSSGCFILANPQRWERPRCVQPGGLRRGAWHVGSPDCLWNSCSSRPGIQVAPEQSCPSGGPFLQGETQGPGGHRREDMAAGRVASGEGTFPL